MEFVIFAIFVALWTFAACSFVVGAGFLVTWIAKGKGR